MNGSPLVEVHDVPTRDANPALREDVDLHRDIGNVLLFL